MRKATGMAGKARRKGFTYTEVLVAVVIVAIAASGLFACVRVTTMTPKTKRTTEMAVYVSVTALERIKAQKFVTMTDITPLPPATGASAWYYDKNGVPTTAASTGGYTVLYGNLLDDTNGDGVHDTRDLRHIVVEVRDNTLAKLYERIDSYVAFGGI
jgi:prepilin-type N-terminal cleavage/methylation domain-containing protein